MNQVSKSLDELLVERAKNGDAEAFERLIQQYEKKVYNFAYRYVGNPEDAADIAQEALVRAYTSLSNFRGNSSFQTWLLRITYNACLDELRKRSRQKLTSIDETVFGDEGEMARQFADSADGPEALVEREELQRTVHETIQELDDEHRTMILMRDLQGYSYNQIADVLGLNLGTVKSRINRARQALKEKFGNLELLTPRVVYSGRRGKSHEL